MNLRDNLDHAQGEATRSARDYYWERDRQQRHRGHPSPKPKARAKEPPMMTDRSSSSAKQKAADRSPSPDRRTKPSLKSHVSHLHIRRRKDFQPMGTAAGWVPTYGDSEDSEHYRQLPGGWPTPPPTSGAPRPQTLPPESGPLTMNSVPQGHRGKGDVNRLDISPANGGRQCFPTGAITANGSNRCLFPDHWARCLLMLHLTNRCGARTCDLKDTCFLELLQQAEATLPAKWTLAATYGGQP